MNIIAPPSYAPYTDHYYRDSLLFVCAPTDKEDELMAISEPAYCREGFSQLVALLRSRSHENSLGEVCYGHRLIAIPSDLTQPRPGSRGKLQLILDGRFYYGQEIAGDTVSSPSVIQYELDKINSLLGNLGLGDIQITRTSNTPILGRVLSDARRYIVSVPETFATNTWTLSVATYITRSILMAPKGLLSLMLGDLLHYTNPYSRLGISEMPLVEAALGYMSAVRPKRYSRVGAHGWSLTFGMANLFTAAGQAIHNERERGHSREAAVRCATTSTSKQEYNEIYDLVEYLQQL